MKRCRGSCLVRPERDPETDVTTMKTIKSLRATLARVALTAGAALATQAAMAVNSLPGGPAVNQLDLHPPVTKIAAEQQWLHWFMLITCMPRLRAAFSVLRRVRKLGLKNNKTMVLSLPASRYLNGSALMSRAS